METPQNPPLPTLPAQLMLALGTWLSSPFGLACASNGFLPSRPELKSLPPSEQASLSQAVVEEAKSRAGSLLSGILRYLDTPYERAVSEPPAIWTCGNARLLDYSHGRATDVTKPIALFIPSLINRYYILDLDEERSILRHFAAQGMYTLALDWGEPGNFEREFDCKKYITEILLPAIVFLHKTSGRKIILVGYCMGGVLATAAAQLAPDKVSRLALLATPWDFHCENFAPFVVSEKWYPLLESQIMSQDTLPADIIQSLFYWTEPGVFEQKFRRFANLTTNSRAAEEFVALERWVNDGVPMTANVARECLMDWAQQNQLNNGRWTVNGQKIDPAKIKIPTFVAIPENDHVVPHDCAMALANALPQAEVVHPSAGHVGMIVSHRAEKELWEPLTRWLKA